MNTAASRIEHLLCELTIEEKVRLCHASGTFSVGPVERLGIPELWMSDGPHGIRQELERTSWKPLDVDWDYSTYLPVGVALAATWNRDLALRFGEVLGSEARARRKDIILGPGLNVMRNPLCGRNFEYLSEDPYLISVLAPQIVLGIQRQDTAACAKHFALNNQELNRHGVDARPDDRTLREIYLPGFEACVKQGGVLTVMSAYNKYFGQWCCHNKRLLCEILKDEWGFEGSVISDWGGCHDGDEAIAHGLDIEMGTSVAHFDDYHLARPYLEKIIRGDVGVEELNDKVRRNLRVMMRIGLLDEATRQPGAQCSENHGSASRAIAEEAVVLLKNEDQLLPLDSTRIKKLAIIGENADTKHAAGGGSSGIKARYEITPLEGLKNLLGDRVEITYAQGYPEQGVDQKREALALACEADAVIFCGGLNHADDNEGADRLTLALEGGQNELIHDLAAINSNLVVLLIGGGPVEMPWINKVKAVMIGWYAGMESGRVFADCLFGNVNPSGKLPVTFPRTLSDCPHARLNDYGRDLCEYREGVFVGHRWYEEHAIEPLFPFGHGISYTTFTYSNLQIQIVSEDACVARVRCHITNTGNRIGKEIVQLYVSDSVCSVKRPAKELKGFQKVDLPPTQTVVVEFDITRRDLSYWSVDDNDWRLEPGEFGVRIGASSADIHLVGSFIL
jgi:beta-glucosidase